MGAGTASSLAIAGVEAELRFAEATPPADDLLAQLPNARLAFLGKRDPDADFELVVRSIIEGVHTCASRVLN